MKKISSYLLNFTAASAGYSEGRLKDDPGNGSGSGVVVATHNDFLYAMYTPIIKYLGALSDTDESQTASDFTSALERIASTVGASSHIASYNYLSGSYILRDGIIWRANANINTGVDGTTFILQYAAGKWVSQVLKTDRYQIYGGSIIVNTTDALHDVDFGATDCFDLTSGDGINTSAITKQMDNTFTAGTNQGMLDTGAVAASTKYYLYAIKKDSDSSADYLASLSASAPTMPAGYTMKRVIGQLMTNSSSQISYVAESVDRVNAQDISCGLLRIQNNEILYNSEKISGVYKYLSTGKAFRTDISTGKKYQVASGTVGATISAWTTIASGDIRGYLIFNTASVPPKVSSGSRDVLGANIQEIADVALALTNAFGVCSQAFADYTYCWMKVLVNDSGQYKYIPSFDSQPVASLTNIAFTGITVAANVATVATTNTTGLAAGHMVILKGSNIGYLIGKVTGVTGGVSFTVKTSAGNGSYTSGTYSAKYRIATLHGTGTIAGSNTDADMTKYTPSPSHNPVYNGYYRDIDGDIVTDSTGVWRDLGPFFIGSAGTILAGGVISYKSCYDKNDNVINGDITFNSTFGSTNTDIYRHSIANLITCRGSDLLFTDSTTLGMTIKAIKDIKITGNVTGYSSNAGQDWRIYHYDQNNNILRYTAYVSNTVANRGICIPIIIDLKAGESIAVNALTALSGSIYNLNIVGTL